MSVEVVIRAGDCPCPGTPHTEERILLRDEASLALSIYAYKMLANTEGDWRAKEASLIAAYIPRGIEAWTFLDQNGEAVPITQENAERLMPWDKGGYLVMEKANDLYSDRVLGPWMTAFLARQKESESSPQMNSSSPTGPKDESTSATPQPGSSLPPPSRRSSRTSSDG